MTSANQSDATNIADISVPSYLFWSLCGTLLERVPASGSRATKFILGNNLMLEVA